METKRRSIELQCSLIEHEKARFVENITDCLSKVLSLSRTACRGELQQLARLSSQLSAHVTSAADEAEQLQHRLSLLAGRQETDGPSPVSWRASDLPSRAGSGTACRRDRAASGGSSSPPSLSQGRRSDRNVALRHLRRAEPAGSGPATDSSVDCRSLATTPAQMASTATSLSGAGDGDGVSADTAAPNRLPSREVNLRVMHDVTLAHHDELSDCDLLYLNLLEDQASLDTLSQDLEELSANPRCQLFRPPRPGDLVFARWDGAWYRGRVAAPPTEHPDPTVEVQFVDYGNQDSVPLAECRRLPERLARMPVCAVECTLTGAVAAPAGWQRQLQVLLIEALLPPAASVQALFQRPESGPLQARLAVTAAVGAESRVLDVGRTLNKALTVSLEDAREQVESRNLALERLMEPFEAPLCRPGGRTSRVLDWLTAGGGGGAEEPPPPPPPPDTGTGEEAVHRISNGRVKQPEPLDPYADPAGGEPARPVRPVPSSPLKTAPQTFIDPPTYRRLTVSWGSRPIYRAPLELCARKSHRDVIIVMCQSPREFYISFESQDVFDDFQRAMQSVYRGLPAHPRQGLHTDLLCVGSFWAARYDGDEWCRVVILEQLEAEGGDGMPSYRVRAVDFGDDLVVQASHLRPMLEQFASQPVFIVRAACSGVAPLGGAAEYSEQARDRFLDLIDEPGVNAHTVSSETTLDCLFVVLYKPEVYDARPITQIMALEGLVEHWEVSEDVATSDEKPAAPALSEDPPYPSPPLGDLPAPAAALSVPPPPLAADSEDGWGVRRPGEPLRLPTPGAVVYVKVTAVVSPELFYVVMPFGARPAQLVNADFEGELSRLQSDDSVETVAAALGLFYGPRPAEGALPGPPERGSWVAVRWQGGWQRATVLSADEDHAEVFLVDWGHWEPVPLEDLRQLRRTFRQLPPQAVPCCLGSAGGGPRPWPAAAVARLVELARRGLLLGHVLAALPTADRRPRLLLDLYHAAGQDGTWASQLCSQ